MLNFDVFEIDLRGNTACRHARITLNRKAAGSGLACCSAVAV